MRTIIVAILASLLCVACGKASNSSSGTARPKVKLQLNWKPEPQFGGFYAAEVEGIYSRHGLDVTITAGGAGAPTVEMIGAGTVPFAIVSGDEIIRARAKDNPVVALFAVYQTNPQGIMTRAARGFKTLSDVFAHPGTLAIERGLPYADFLEKKYGFAKLKIVPSPFGDLSLYRTQPDYAMQCFVTSEPLAAKETGIEPQTFLIAESGYNPYTTVLATSESYLKANPRIVKSMIEAVREGWQNYLADPTQTNEYMGKLNPTMDAKTFKDSAKAQKPLIETGDTKRLGLGAMTIERWQMLVQQLVDLKVINNQVDAQASFAEPTKSK
ncbi:MAG TPA: ABC transporter substrate-binding protein [Candidatus Udaeobacter sp.]|nr:ABC transporter substrate-binding protein [Candidatus Udaeobacter sp.]